MSHLVDNLHLVVLVLLDLVGGPRLPKATELVSSTLEDRQVEIPAGGAVLSQRPLQSEPPLLPEIGSGLLRVSDVVIFLNGNFNLFPYVVEHTKIGK